MRHTNIKWIASAAIFGFGASAFAQDAEPEVKSINDEIRTMSQVLQKSLQRADLMEDGTRVGRSLFDGSVRGSYIPTVGAVFRINVDFPIVEPKNAPADAAPVPKQEDEETDLWERYSDRGNGPAVYRLDGRPDGTPKRVDVEPLVGDIVELESIIGEGVQHVGEKVKAVVAAHLDEDVTAEVDNEVLQIVAGDRPKYDPARVESLRRTVIETIGKYGHRMTQLQDGDRVLVVVEAPKERAVSKRIQYKVRHPEGAAPAPYKTREEIERDIEHEIRRGDGSGPSEWGGWTSRARGPQAMLWGGPRGGGPRDSYLFSFGKPDLAAETTFDALQGRVQEVRY